MSASRGLLSVASRLLPEGDRPRKVEEWEADLAYCSQLSIGTAQVGWGMISSAFRLRSLDFSRALKRSKKERKMNITLGLIATGVIVGAGAILGVGNPSADRPTNVQVVDLDPAMVQPLTPQEQYEIEHPTGPFEILGGEPAAPIPGLPPGDSN